MSIYTVPEEWRLQLYNNPTHSLYQLASDDDELWHICMHELIGLVYGVGGNLYERTPERRAELSAKMKKVNAENDYWKLGVESARQSCLGKKQSSEHVEKRMAAKRKKVRVNGVIYNSCTDASIALGITKSAVTGRLQRGKSAHYV